jgi:hypothetical protein
MGANERGKYYSMKEEIARRETLKGHTTKSDEKAIQQMEEMKIGKG